MSVLSRITAQPSRVEQTKPSEYLIRFAFGGVITAVVGIIGKAFGPVVAGLFLAFPAILPASLTLISKHDDRRAAGADAVGAVMGSIGLIAFALVVWKGAAGLPAWALLALATAAWFALSFAIWWGFVRVRHG